MNVLFVCTGNTCRSPMAEELADDATGRSTHLEDMVFKSAGTFACEGAPASPEAVAVLEELDINLSRHRSHQFNKELSEWADLILAMEAKHIEEMEAMAPEQAHKMHTLLGYAAGITGYPGESGYDVMDPYRAPIEDYRAARDQISDAIMCVLKKLESGQLV